MLVLGLETSCDETSAAVVEDGRLVRSNVVSSQTELHAPFGGVVPEIASRQHIRVIDWIVREALNQADVSTDDIDVVAATRGPGLAGALLVGFNFGRGLTLALDLPFVPVNHLDGHLHSAWLTREEPPPPEPQFPMVALIVSGGHTELVLVRDHGDYTLLGHTVDDAAGEAFDKVGRLLGLPFPGGPAIQRISERAADPVVMPRAWLPNTLDFSFSGLKTAVLHAAHQIASGEGPESIRGRPLPRIDVASGLDSNQVANLAAGFQDSVVDVLTTKTVRAARQFRAASVAVVGGVAANGPLRTRMRESIDVPLYIPPVEFSTDNAAMIASAGFFVPEPGDDAVDVSPGLQLVAE